MATKTSKTVVINCSDELCHKMNFEGKLANLFILRYIDIPINMFKALLIA